MKQNCANSSIQVFNPSNDEWNRDLVFFLTRRLGYSVDYDLMSQYLKFSPSELVDKIIDEALSKEVTADPGWADWTSTDFKNSGKNRFEFFRDHQRIFFNDVFNNGFREKLTVFWSNHFVTQYSGYSHPAYAFRYYNTIQKNVLGNFKDFVYEIGLDDAMLMYLNGYENKNVAPNDNYSRELYELFTLGEGNGYTENDIKETSRALTGFNSRVDQGPISFNEKWFDDGEKTIFGRSGNWGYQDVIEILFEEKKELISKFICSKIYTHFVNPSVDEDFIEKLSEFFIESEFNLESLLRKLFKSEHFFDSYNRSVLIKEPIDLLCSIHNHLKFSLLDDFDFDDFLLYGTITMGQEILQPVDVAGWKGNHDWISTGTFPVRWEWTEWMIWEYWKSDQEQFRKLLKKLVSTDETNPEIIVKSFFRFLLCEYEINEQDLIDGIEVFKNDLPDIYFSDGTWNLDYDSASYQTCLLLMFILKLPEYQLK